MENHIMIVCAYNEARNYLQTVILGMQKLVMTVMVCQ